MELRVVSVESPPPASTPELTQDHIDAGMRALFVIAARWQLSNTETQALLGSPARATFYNWKAGKVSQVSRDTMARISFVLGIYKDLQILYADPAQANQWIKRANKVFGGDTAIARMTAGNVTDLAQVRDHLDAVRGGWC